MLPCKAETIIPRRPFKVNLASFPATCTKLKAGTSVSRVSNEFERDLQAFQKVFKTKALH
jgi:hypothetical protein